MKTKTRKREPSSFVRTFQPRFAELVASGEKRQTVRKRPRRMPRAGDYISCRMWTGRPYQSKQRLLCEGIIDAVHNIKITRWTMDVDGERVPAHYREEFAIADGFQSWAELREWFMATHKLPFSGIIIRWTPVITP